MDTNKILEDIENHLSEADEDNFEEETAPTETNKQTVEVMPEKKSSPLRSESLPSAENEPKKTPIRDSDFFHSAAAEAIQFQPIYRRASSNRERDKSPESELEEISGNDFKKKSPDKKIDHSTDSRAIFFDAQGKPHTKGFDDPEEVSEFVYSSAYNENHRETSDSSTSWKGGKSYSSWKEQELEVPVNCVMIYNLEPRVDEEIIYELFSKIGKIKRMKLFRLAKKEIENSTYLRTLNLGNTPAKPHKKKALIEYHAPNYVDTAIEVFNNIKLFGRKIFVMKYRDDHQKFNIIITRPNDQSMWLDEYFCLDYFSRVTNIVRVWTKKEADNRIKIVLFFVSQFDWEEARDAINKELKKYFNNRIEVIYTPPTNIYSKERRREVQAKNPERIQSINLNLPSIEEGGVQLSDYESGEDKSIEIQ